MRAQAFARVAAGFTLTIVDTPGLLEGDAVNTGVRSSTPACPQYLCFSFHASLRRIKPAWKAGKGPRALCRVLRQAGRWRSGRPCRVLL